MNSECTLMDICKFFKVALRNKPSTAELFLTRYCKKDFKDCARYIIYTDMGVKKVPDDLFPNQTERLKNFKARN